MVKNGQSSELLSNIALAGFLISAAGTFFAALFSADKSDVRRLMKESDDYADGRYMVKPHSKPRPPNGKH